MRILRNKWTYAALGSFMITGILLFSVYAFRAVERSFYPRTFNGLQVIHVVRNNIGRAIRSGDIREHYVNWDRTQMVAHLRHRLQQRHA